jgi:DNA processing protein
MIHGMKYAQARKLLETLGSAEAIFSEEARSLQKIPGMNQAVAGEIKRQEVLKRAEDELVFIEKNRIACLFITEEDYPLRLQQCGNAPLVLYFKGNTDLNARRIISVVGTRKATEYGRELTEELIRGLSAGFPDVLIVSGLAYGIDILAHKSALMHRLSTIGVLAHGLNRIYPSIHRPVAIDMLAGGGVLTEYPNGTAPYRPNFIRRNRIIAGLADATVIVESADKGGSLVTADLALSYDREVYAFPGRAADVRSQGCNRIIRQNRAGLITCADDLIRSMNWESVANVQELPSQTSLTFPGKEENVRILQLLREKKKVHVNELAIDMDLPVHQLSDILFELEIDGYIKTLPGNSYSLA